MKHNDIFRLALQAGFKEGDLSLFPSLLTKFADLVAAEVGIAQWHRGFAEGQAVKRELTLAEQKNSELSAKFDAALQECAATHAVAHAVIEMLIESRIRHHTLIDSCILMEQCGLKNAGEKQDD